MFTPYTLADWTIALATDDDRLVQRWLDNTPDLLASAHDLFGTSLLIQASRAGAVKIVAWVLPMSDPLAADEQGNTALLRAAEEGHVAVIDLLLPASDVGHLDRNGRTALHIAAGAGKADAVRMLLPRIPATTLSSMDTLALHDAADDGTVEVLDLLLPFGGTNHQDSAGWTPIMYAAINARDEALARLAPLTDLTLRNEEQDLALDIAHRRGVPKNERVLLAAMQRQEAAMLRGALVDLPTEPAALSPVRARL